MLLVVHWGECAVPMTRLRARVTRWPNARSGSLTQSLATYPLLHCLHPSAHVCCVCLRLRADACPNVHVLVVSPCTPSLAARVLHQAPRTPATQHCTTTRLHWTEVTDRNGYALHRRTRGRPAA